MEATADGLVAHFADGTAPPSDWSGRVLVAETFETAAGMFDGTVTGLRPPKRK